MTDKSYESYEMLAKLLNSGRKENIDNVYDALSEVISGEYQLKKQQNKNTYTAKRNALANNKAKAEKYLDYFMTDKGYNGSGIEADAKLKASMGYNSDLASLYAAEAQTDAALDSEYNSAKLKNEAERSDKKAAADKDYGDALYKAYSDEADRAIKREQLDYQRESDEADRAIKRDQFDYQKESDASDRALKRDQFDYQKESDASDRAFKQSQFEYQKESDASDRTLKQSQFDYQKESDAADRAFKQSQLDYQREADEKDRTFKQDQLDYQRESDDKDRELKRSQQDLQNELEKQKAKSDSEYKNKQLQQQKYLQEKENEIKMLQIQADTAKSSASNTAQKEEAELLKEKLDSYRQLLYQELKTQFDMTNDVSEKQRIYDSVTGVNAEQATEIYGATLYKSMIKDFSKALTEAKAKKADAETVQKLYDRFVNAKDEYHYQTYMKLKRELQYSNFPGFTEDQLERAYKAYVKNGQVG